MDISLSEDVKSDVYRCFRCGYCRAVCPTFIVKENESWNARGRLMLIQAALENKIVVNEDLKNRIYSCTLCRACELVCPALVKVTKAILNFRESLIKTGYSPPRAYIKVIENIKKTGNVFGVKSVKEQFEYKNCENIFFPGCVAYYMKPELVNYGKHIFGYCNIEWCSSEGICCGSPLYALGMTEEFKEVAKKNLELFRKFDVKRIITLCPLCYKTLKYDYPKVLENFDFEVLHISQFLNLLIADGLLKPMKSVNLKVVYFDSCGLGRLSNIYDVPRDVLKAIPGLEVIEFKENREKALCCGGGFGLFIAYPELSSSLSKIIIRNALDLGAEVIASDCPTCQISLENSVRKTLSPICIANTVEIIAESI